MRGLWGGVGVGLGVGGGGGAMGLSVMHVINKHKCIILF